MEPTMSYEAEFVRLGNRSYVQGGTITFALLTAIESWNLGAVERVQAYFHRINAHHGTFHLFANDSPPIENQCVAVFRVFVRESKHWVALVPRGDRVTASIPYDEELLISPYTIDGTTKTITSFTDADDLKIDKIIAMNKKLLLSILPTRGYSGWLLSRYDLLFGKSYLRESENLRLTLVGNLGSTNCRSHVVFGKNPIGHIYFSRAKSHD